MRVAFSLLLLVHALIHVMGFVKAFGFAALPQLTLPISRSMGVVWLSAALWLLAADVTLFVAPRWFWLVGAVGLLLSQAAIVASWHDARFGTLANVVLLFAVVYGAFAWGPFGLRAEYERLTQKGFETISTRDRGRLITEADLATLPPAVQRYLQFVGVVGTPRVHGFRTRMTGRIRSSAEAPWMPFVAEQHSFFDPPRRYFWMEATRAGLPVDGLHAYDNTDASMRIRLLSLIPVVDQSGQEMARTETVTILNDASIMAPAHLLDPAIEWREVDAHSVEATYTVGPQRIRAVLVFDDSGALVNFWSDDRPALAEDGTTMVSQRWSTPIRDYRRMGPYRLASRGEGRYAASTGDYAYLELDGIDVITNIAQSAE